MRRSIYDDAFFFEDGSDDGLGLDFGRCCPFAGRLAADRDRGPTIGVAFVLGAENPKRRYRGTAILTLGFHATVVSFFACCLELHVVGYV